MIYKGEDIKEFLKRNISSVGKIGDHHIVNKFNIDGCLNHIIDNNYETTNKKISGYKVMYVRANADINYKEDLMNYVKNDSSISGIDILTPPMPSYKKATVYIPTLVKVEIPYHSIIYTDHDFCHKCRTDKAVITEVYDPTYYQQVRHDSYRDVSRNIVFVCTLSTLGIVAPRIERSWAAPVFTTTGGIARNCFRLVDSDYIVKYDNLDLSKLYSNYELDSSLDRLIPKWTSVNTYIEDLANFHSALKEYHPNEKIVIDNFNILPYSCSTGFHFFKDMNHLLMYFK